MRRRASLRQTSSATPAIQPGTKPSAAILVSSATASVSPSAAASHGVSPRRNARANSQNITQPAGISSASGLTPPEIHANTGCHAQINAASSARERLSGNSSSRNASTASTATPASSADAARSGVTASSVLPPAAVTAR